MNLFSHMYIVTRTEMTSGPVAYSSQIARVESALKAAVSVAMSFKTLIPPRGVDANAMSVKVTVLMAPADTHGMGANLPVRIMSTCWSALQLEVYYRYLSSFDVEVMVSLCYHSQSDFISR